MWKDDFGTWNKGFRIVKFSSLPQDCGVPEDRFLVAFLFRESDGSWTLELWLKGRSICTNKARMACPTPLAVDFALRSRAEAKALRAEKKARNKRIEEEHKKIVTLLSSPDTERWIDLTTGTLYERVTVWQKGVRRFRSESFGGGGYRESTKSRSLSPEEISELIRQDEAEREKRKAAEDEAAAYQKRMREYQSLWEAHDDEEIIDGFRVRTCYGGPHIADKSGNVLFSIPRDIKSLEELKQRIEGLLDEYFQDCE